MKIALAGNPNSGKTTLYNALTGKQEYVGNWAGVKVSKKEAKLKESLGNNIGNDVLLQNGKNHRSGDLPQRDSDLRNHNLFCRNRKVTELYCLNCLA